MADTVARRLRAGEHAPELTLTNVHSEPVALSALWRERPILLTFLRHFG
jgi:peroxiredoxin